MAGVHLTLTDDRAPAVDALAERLGGRIGLPGVLDRLDRRVRPSRLGRLAGRFVDEAYAWERRDARDHRWWPQGVTGSADADPSERVLGRRLLLVSWYSRAVAGQSHGSRVTLLDLDSRRYRHVLLAVPRQAADGSVRLAPLKVHAGGVVWVGGALHVAATARGLVTCHLDDVVLPGPTDETFGHDLVLPVRSAWRGGADAGVAPFRYSFVSLDRSGAAPELVAGEYGRGEGATTRLARYALDAGTGQPTTDAEGRARPREVADADRPRMQGVVRVGGQWHTSVSQGPWLPGSLASGRPGALRARRLALPMGPEDLMWWPSTRRLWSVSEHPGRRWVFSAAAPAGPAPHRGG